MQFLFTISFLVISVAAEEVHLGLVEGVKVSQNFIGVSVEVAGMIEYVGVKGDRRSYAQALANLRKSVGDYAGPTIRIGGNSADASCWGPDATSLCVSHNITAADLAAYRTFVTTTAKDVNTSLVIDTNFGSSVLPSAYTVPYIKALNASGMWDIISAVEIGNEMGLYHEQKHPYRNASYTFEEYFVEFGEFVDAAVAAGLPEGKIRGGTWCCNPKGDYAAGLQRYLSEYGAQFNSMSLHQYAVSYCSKNANQTILGEDQAYGALHNVYSANTSYTSLIDVVTANNIPFFMGEANTASCGGIPGVSDTFAAALWAMDYLPTLAQTNASGIHFHGGTHGAYTPLAYNTAGDLQVRPLYYGMLAFAEFSANGARFLEVTRDVPGDVRCTGGVLEVGSKPEVCCAASCGVCGGGSCGESPGGAEKCCVSNIKASNRSCMNEEAPCYRTESDGNALNIHAITDGVLQQTRVLVVAKYLHDTAPQHQVSLCSRFSFLSDPTPASFFYITAPHKNATFGTGLSYGGQTFDNSTDGVIQGQRETHLVEPYVGAGSVVCYNLSVPAFSAVLLTVQEGW